MNWMNEDHTRWTDHLSDYIDGSVDPTVAAELEDHLAQCGACRGVLEELRRVVALADALPEVEPADDLWSGIEATILGSTPSADPKVIALPVGAGPGRGRSDEVAASRDTVRLTRPQLIAASVALIAVSSVVTAQVGPTWGAPSEVSSEVPDGAVTMVANEPVVPPPPAIAQELAALEEVMNEARTLLDPNTVRVIERNLAVIEQAIADSQNALRLDPGNEYLAEHLTRVYQRKLTYLRDAANVAEWSS